MYMYTMDVNLFMSCTLAMHNLFFVKTWKKNKNKYETKNNERVISTFKFDYPHLTLKEGPKLESDHIRRFPAHDFL